MQIISERGHQASVGLRIAIASSSARAVSAGAAPDHERGEEVDDEPEADALVEIDEIEDKQARKKNRAEQRNDSMKVERRERSFQPEQEERNAREEEGEDQKPQRQCVKHHQNLQAHNSSLVRLTPI